MAASFNVVTSAYVVPVETSDLPFNRVPSIRPASENHRFLVFTIVSACALTVVPRILACAVSKGYAVVDFG